MRPISTLIFGGPLIPEPSAVAPLALAQGRPWLDEAMSAAPFFLQVGIDVLKASFSGSFMGTDT